MTQLETPVDTELNPAVAVAIAARPAAYVMSGGPRSWREVRPMRKWPVRPARVACRDPVRHTVNADGGTNSYAYTQSARALDEIVAAKPDSVPRSGDGVDKDRPHDFALCGRRRSPGCIQASST